MGGMPRRVLRRSRADRAVEEATVERAAAPTLSSAALAKLPADSPVLAALRQPGGLDHLSNGAAVRALAGGTPAAQEAAADRVADALTGDPAPATPGPLADTGTARSPAARGGGSLPGADRAFFEERLGHDLRAVRIHHDADAAGQAGMLNARAFTVGTDIYLGRDQPRPGTAAGRHLLAHELAHVVQQGSALAVQCQEVPDELRATPDYRDLTDEALHQRHDWILEVLKQFTQSTPDSALLERQAAEIATELASRAALAAGRTFRDEDIERARAYFIRNARNEKDSCIVALNKGLKAVTGDAALPTTPRSIEATMAKVIESGHAEPPEEIAFQAANGRITRGGARPEKLDQSVWQTLRDLAEGDPGWSVFTMSLLDGYHSVTLTLDARDPADPHVYWSDQWHSKGGWKEYKQDTLDAEVTRLVQGWWDAQEEGHKHTTVVRVWRIRAKAAP
jgi:hypothetical protein